MEKTDQDALVATHAHLVKRVRRIGIFVAIVLVFAANLHFERLNQVKRESAVREAFLLSVSADSPLLKDAPPPPALFRSETIPRLHREIQSVIDMARTSSPYSVFGLQLPFESYVLLLLFGGTAALAGLWVTLHQLRKLHRVLAAEARDGGALQMALNSVFFTRFTSRYGHRWAGQAALGLVPIVLLSIATPLIVLSSGIMRLSPELYRMPDGSVSGTEDINTVPVVIDSVRASGAGTAGMWLFAVDLALGVAVLVTGFRLPGRVPPPDAPAPPVPAASERAQPHE